MSGLTDDEWTWPNVYGLPCPLKSHPGANGGHPVREWASNPHSVSTMYNPMERLHLLEAESSEGVRVSIYYPLSRVSAPPPLAVVCERVRMGHHQLSL